MATFQVTVTAKDGRVFRSRTRARSAQQAVDLAIGSFTRYDGQPPAKVHAAQIVWSF